MTVRILHGDCRDVLATLKPGSVQCCVTSPPYFGLRDYGHAEQIGLEPTPDEFVAALVQVFREVRRVLRDDGTLWLNLGDTYAGNRGAEGANNRGLIDSRRRDNTPVPRSDGRVAGLKPKDLIGVPWRVAFALQQPYYTGLVKDERDRVWLAAMLDAEGSICGTEYLTGDRTKTNIYISITNTSVPIIDKCERLFPQDVKHVYEKAGPSSRICYRWDVERMDTKALFLREIYPHLVAKRKQAILGYTFIEMQRGLVSKKKGYLPEQHEQRSWLMAALSKLNSGEDVDLPDWVIEPPTLLEPGYYLRQDIIWAKPNPMPESVRDRCTKAHEYVFLFAKSEQYFYDTDAISEPSSGATEHDLTGRTKQRTAGGERAEKRRTVRPGVDTNGGGQGAGLMSYPATTRNRRSVWTIPTRPFAEAHFATMAPGLAETCILAGTRPGDTVLDPFGGAGTTGLVADRLQRDALLIELNPDYAAMALRRCAGDSPLFADVIGGE